MDPIDEIVEELLASAQALPESHPAPKYPKDHRAAMRVPKGGSSCASCEFLGKDEKSCTNKFFIAWNNGSDVLPFAADEFCSDWYEHSGLDAAGTSEGAIKGWDARGRNGKYQEGTFKDNEGGTLWHGTRQPGRKFRNGEIAYLTPTHDETLAYARGEIPGTAHGNKPAVMAFMAKPGKTVDVNENVEDAISDDKDLDAIFDDARTQLGARYATFNHPSTLGNQGMKVVVSLYPHEDLKGLGGHLIDASSVWAGDVNAYGTSEGVQKAWDTRGRGRKEAVDYVKTVRSAKDADIESLNTWRKVATESYNKAPNADVKKNLRHASNVASWVVSDWEDEQRGSRTGKSSPFFVVDSPKNGIVGVINLHQSTTSGFDHVSTLVTRPDVIAGLTDERGVGTKLMIQAAKYAASRGNGLDLSSLSGAEGFYRKLGMHETPPVSRNGMSEFSWTAEETGQMAKGTVD